MSDLYEMCSCYECDCENVADGDLDNGLCEDCESGYHMNDGFVDDEDDEENW